MRFPSDLHIVNTTNTSVLQPVVTPSAWRSDKYNNSKEWLRQLSPEHLRELRAAVDLHKDVPEEALHTLSASDFPLPTLGPVLLHLRDDKVNGKGFALLSGISTADYSLRYALVAALSNFTNLSGYRVRQLRFVCGRDLIIAYWAIVQHIGKVQVTNKYGHLIGHVKDHGRDPKHPLTRLYSTNAAQPIHCDSAADIIGLCCVHQANSGGKPCS